MLEFIVPALQNLLTIENLIWINLGVFIGSVFAAIPGLTVILCIILFLPFTYQMTAIPGMMFLLGIYCAGGYGGSVSAILINTPGTPHAAATMLDGYPLNQKGRTKAALKIALYASTFGGIFSALMLLFLAPQVAKVAAMLGTAEYFLVCLFGLTIIAGVSTVVGEMGIPYAQGGILGMAVFYLLFALLLKILGKDRVARVFPPIIVGPIIMVLGLSLASVGVQEAEANWPIAIITFLIAVGVNNFSKGLTRVMTIIIALVGGYLISIPFGLVDFTALKEAAWIGVPSFTLPQFSWRAIALIAPCAIVPCLEHIGDVMAVGTVVGKDFTHEPGLDRSVFACGVSTVLSGCLGGPSLTIHSENTGVLAVTHLYSPTIVRFGALWMALLAFCPKFNALCGSIPQAVLGGVGILLYGMVTSTGIRTLVDHHVDFSQPRNLCIAAAILILGVGGAAISFGSITLSGMAFAAIAGIILHFVLPGREKI